MDIDPAWLAHTKLAVASLCGGLTRLFIRPVEGESLRHSVLKSTWMLFGCVTCGFYGTHPLMSWLDLSDSYTGAIGALLGFVGLSFAEGFLKAVEAFDFRAWLKSVLKAG